MHTQCLVSRVSRFRFQGEGFYDKLILDASGISDPVMREERKREEGDEANGCITVKNPCLFDFCCCCFFPRQQSTSAASIPVHHHAENIDTVS
jgi:hypothetical protein